jgi:hypothetical protein
VVCAQIDFEGMRKKTVEEKNGVDPNFQLLSIQTFQTLNSTSMACPRLSTRRFGVRKPAQV